MPETLRTETADGVRHIVLSRAEALAVRERDDPFEDYGSRRRR